MTNQKKWFEGRTEHVDSLPNNTSETVSDSSNQENHNTYFNAVYDLIPTGQRKAISMSELATMLATNERETRRIVSEMRADGFLICSDSHGYFKPQTTGELQSWYRQAKARASTTIKGLKHAEDILDNHRGILPGVAD